MSSASHSSSEELQAPARGYASRSIFNRNLLPQASPASTSAFNSPTEQLEDPFATPVPSRAPSIHERTRPSTPVPQLASAQDRRALPARHASGRQPHRPAPPIPREVITVHRPSITDIRANSTQSVASAASASQLRSEDDISIAEDTPGELTYVTPDPEKQDDGLDTQTAPEKWKRGPGFWTSFISICVPLLLSALEGSITNTALPTIAESLDLGTKFSWVATAYLLASTILQPLYGQLADMWGRKYPMILAVFIFACGSVICGWATGSSSLILGRVVQGFGTGGIDLFAELILTDLVPLRQRGTYLAIKHLVFATGTTIGPLLGGVFADHNWRWCFWINIPVCFLSILLLWFWLSIKDGVKKDVALRSQLLKIDGVGTGILVFSAVLVLYSLSTAGASQPWSHTGSIAPLTIGMVGFIIFPFWETSRRCEHPIMPPNIFKNRTSSTAFALTAIHGFLTYGMQFYLPPYFQGVMLSKPSLSGVQVLPTTLGIVLMAAAGGPLLTLFGKYKPIHQMGFACMTVSLGLLTTLTRTTKTWEWVIYQLVGACGSGIIVSTLLPAICVELPDSANGAAAGSWAFLRGTGSLFGVAIPGAIFNLQWQKILPGIVSERARHGLQNGQAYQRASEIFIRGFDEYVQGQIVEGFEKSLRWVWVCFAIAAGVGWCLVFLEREVKMRKGLDTQFGLKDPKTEGVENEKEDTTDEAGEEENQASGLFSGKGKGKRKEEDQTQSQTRAVGDEAV